MSSNVGGTFSTFGGNDFFSLGDYANSTVDRVIDGGSGYDIIQYTGNFIQSLVSKVGNVIKIGSNTDTLTNVEEIRFDDAVLDTATFTVTPLNAPPVAVDDLFGVDEDQTLTGNVLGDNGNGPDSDPDGDALTVTLISGPSEGILWLNADGLFNYEADSDVFDLAAPGDVIEQSFTYQIDDGTGAIDQAKATIFVTILDDGETISAKNGKDDLIGTDGGEDILEGGNGKDRIFGLDGADHLFGGNGKDLLEGGEGPDKLYGGNGKDTLIGGLGNDELTGGKGNDTFIFALGEGTDTVLDYEVGEDLIGLAGLTFGDVSIGQVGGDATISSSGELLAVLVGVDSSTLAEPDFLFIA